jgi:hypothetical protein
MREDLLTSRNVLLGSFILAIAAVTLLVVRMVVGTPALATHVTPVTYPDNPTCGELVPDTIEFKIEPVADGTYSNGVLTVTLDVRDTPDGPVVDWTSNFPIQYVFVKGGPNGNLYTYNPPVTSDTGLHSPVNPENGKYYGLSHISFCYSADATIDITPDGVNEVGDPHKFTAEVQTIGGNIATSGANTPLCVTFTIQSGPGEFTTPDDGNDCNGNGNNLDDCTIAGGSNEGDCSAWIVSNVSGTTVVRACAPIPIDTNGDGATDVTKNRCTGGASNPDGEKVWVNAKIRLTPPTDTNFIYDTHDITCWIKINKGDGAGFVNAPDGTLCDADIDSGPGSFVNNDDDCLVDGGDGNCVITITSSTTGTTTVSACTEESAPPGGLNVEGVLLSRCTDGSEVEPGRYNGNPVTKNWRSGSVTLNKTFEIGPFTPLGQVCFTLSRTPGAPPPISSDPLIQCGTGASLSFTWDDLVAGLHCIDETTVPPPYLAMVQICFTVDAQNLNFSFSRNNPLPPGDLRILKTGVGGSTWTGPDVVFFVCPHSPPGDPTELSPAVCDGVPEPPEFDVTFPSGQATPLTVANLDEGYYTICEVVPPDFAVNDQCQVAGVRAGVTGDDVVPKTFVNTFVGDGCTPGFWKTHPVTAVWGPTGYSPSQTVESVFDVPDAYGLDNKTLVQALGFDGGPGAKGAAKILLRAGVAALLNDAHPSIGYAYSGDVVADVNAALATGSRSAMLALATQLDALNNSGCSIDAHGDPIDA